MKDRAQRIALPVAVVVLIVVWIFLVATVVFDVAAPGWLTVAAMIAGIVAGIGAFVWFTRNARSL